MLEGVIWFISVILVVLLLYIAEDYIRSTIPGFNKAWLLQPVYRMLRLFGKKDMNPACPSKGYSAAAFWFACCALYFAVAGSHLLFVCVSLVLMELFILAGAWNHGAVFAAMAAQRGIVRMLICSFAVLISAASVFQVTETLNLKQIFEYSQVHGLLLQLPLAFLAMFAVLLTRGNLLFFDFSIAGKGTGLLDSPLNAPYGGWSLALAQITHWVEIGVWMKLVSMFLPFTPWVSFLVTAFCYLVFLLLDGFTARSQWKIAARNTLIWCGGMAAMNYIWLVLL